MNPEGWLATRSGALSSWLAALICCGVAALAWLGYRATDEWQLSSAQLVQRRTQEVAVLLTTALTRDMRSVQVSILDGRDWDARSLSEPYEMNDTVQAAFARYPYPEAFFAWYRSVDSAFFMSRSDRRPSWLKAPDRADTYPVEIIASPTLARPLLDRVGQDIRNKNQYSLFETTIAGRHYQVISRILYGDATRDHADGILGFVVDLAWVRQHYFSSITDQVIHVARADDGVDITIVDETDTPVVGASTKGSADIAHRSFPVYFFDPAIVIGGTPKDLAARTWAVQASPGNDPTLAIAALGARRTLLVIAAGAIALGVGLVFTARATRAAAAMATMRSDFVATVTHALKTPVSVIRGIGETLVRGRVDTQDRLREYAQLLVQESHRLARLIDNMLAYARVTDAANVYVFERQDPAEVVDEVVRGFHRLVKDGLFAVDVMTDPAVPSVRADRTAVVLALDNLFDNAMKYSGTARTVTVRTALVGAQVEFAITDGGSGISSDDLIRIRRRSVRGRSATGHGSGLGLAIAQRIAKDHRGSLRLESVVGTGTTATLSIPRWP